MARFPITSLAASQESRHCRAWKAKKIVQVTCPGTVVRPVNQVRDFQKGPGPLAWPLTGGLEAFFIKVGKTAREWKKVSRCSLIMVFP